MPKISRPCCKLCAIVMFALAFVSLFDSSAGAQAVSQNISVKEGFNFVSFTLKPLQTPQQLVSYYPQINEIYSYSPASGSFLTVGDGTLSTLNAGKGYIIKADGAAWVKSPDASPFGGLLNTAMVEMNGSVLAVGGAIGWSSVTNSVWHTTNGASWATAYGQYPARTLHGAAVLNNKLYGVGGMTETTGSEKSDCWIGTLK